jgi:hypothetical protein
MYLQIYLHLLLQIYLQYILDPYKFILNRVVCK